MDDLRELRDRLDNAQHALVHLAMATPVGAFERRSHLEGKMQGVKLALSYVDEMLADF